MLELGTDELVEDIPQPPEAPEHLDISPPQPAELAFTPPDPLASPHAHAPAGGYDDALQQPPPDLEGAPGPHALDQLDPAPPSDTRRSPSPYADMVPEPAPSRPLSAARALRGTPAPDPAATTAPPQLHQSPSGPQYLEPEELSAEQDLLVPVGDEELEAEPTRIEHESNLGLADHRSTEPELEIIGGNNRGQCFGLRPGDNSIGRGVDNDIILADIAVSRKHTLICYEGGQFVVRDLGSGNGTLVNSGSVESHVLADGDQLELGNTLLRFNNPLAQPPPDELAHLETVVQREPVYATANVRRSQLPQRQLPAAAAIAATASAAKTAEPTREERRRSSWLDNRRVRLLLFGSLAVVLVLGLALGIKLGLSSRDDDAAQSQSVPPDELAASEYKQGISQYNAKNWAQARLHFQKVVQLAPSAEQAKRYLSQASAEMQAQGALHQAKQHLTAGRFADARGALTRIPAASAYAADAMKIKERVDDEQVASLLDAVRAHLAQQETAEARSKLAQAAKIAPTNPAVLRLSDQLSRGDDGAPPAHRRRPHRAPVVPQQTPRPAVAVSPGPAAPGPAPSSRGKLGPALAAYRKQSFGEAVAAVNALAQQASGKEQRSLRALSAAMATVHRGFRKAKSGGSAAETVSHLQRALRADRKVPKAPHHAALKQLLLQAAKDSAAQGVARGNFAQVGAALKAARTAGVQDPVLNRAGAKLEQHAMQLFNRGYTIRKSNLPQARRLWQQILKLVPHSSKAYQQAYNWLNNSAPSYQDEDED